MIYKYISVSGVKRFVSIVSGETVKVFQGETPVKHLIYHTMNTIEGFFHVKRMKQ